MQGGSGADSHCKAANGENGGFAGNDKNFEELARGNRAKASLKQYI